MSSNLPRTSESSMQYGHMAMPERRDSNLDSAGSAQFQSHPALSQALGNHLPGQAYSRTTDTYRISPGPSPSPIHAQNGAPQGHPAASTHSSLGYNVAVGQSSPPLKRKPVDNVITHVKRRREDDISDGFDADGTAQGAKHWTDEEKSKLFNWLMGPGHDDHWNALRATKNSCLRECAIEVFGAKKTYQALKGCYERNFNLFKQIYAFESYNPHNQAPNISSLSEADRLREYERRLSNAKKAGCDVGNITARTIDHWHRAGWYDLFYRRWHGDPATTNRPTMLRPSLGGSNGDDQDGEEDPALDYANPVNSISSMSHPGHPDHNQQPISFVNHHPQHQAPPPPPPHPQQPPQPPPISLATNHIPNGMTISPTQNPSSPMTSGESLVTITMTQSMAASYMQYLQVQTQAGKFKMEYLKRRDEREEKESIQRREAERLRIEREASEHERLKQDSAIKARTDRAIEILNTQSLDPSVKAAAGEYIKKLFSD